MQSRRKIAILVAELLGTGVLTLVILAAGRSIGYAYFIAVAAGLAVAGLTLAVGSVSGAHFNPAITFGMWTVRKAKLVPAIAYIVMQFLGAFLAYALYTYFVNSKFNGNHYFDGRVLMAEAIGAFIFSMGWAAVVFQKLQGAKAAATVGISLTLGMIVASLASSAFINPAIAFGVHSWVWGSYALGPILGGIIGFNLYALLFAPAEEMAKIAEPAATGKKRSKK